ncbi:polyphosphate kinase 2 family protein [Tamlana sp. 2_MG-2023]|uniref:PPK2 family polyphosphate kinase n=1 Tax=unclassified Tamlana TaxID=2614803 RepID=UPI0026E31CA9|nr:MULTISPECIES: PPK2 family polyphosphate kinase [unclassified Tamlana]MDO6759049.1 polyphosphate kinase 2 family protein [Tamlana sp. 2_MG-2023]MDO6789748.1 polyphosphate kinase 2 family protein [Tamlana sp. 1_MG-2023]
MNIDHYKVTSNITLKNSQTKVVIDDAEKELKKVRKKLGKLQDTLYAHGKYAVLVCLQGMDTAGKDSLIREVFKGFNSRGVVVHSFKVPTELELKHDFIWRHYIALPARGKFGVFNRTHYENVLVTRVHPEYVLGENLPNIHSVNDVDAAFWDRRFEQINNFEKHVAQNGTLIFKFFLNLSKKEQKDRLLRRLNKKEKNWKFSPGDLKERKLWDKYQVCYEEAINKTSKPHAPWYAIPADDKPSARYLVAKIIYDTLKQFDDIQEPELDEAVKVHLEEYKKELNNE